MKIEVTTVVDAPDGATHYAGELLDEPTWWKFLVNSTGVIRVWCYYCNVRNGWFISGEHKPHWIKELPTNGK